MKVRPRGLAILIGLRLGASALCDFARLDARKKSKSGKHGEHRARFAEDGSRPEYREAKGDSCRGDAKGYRQPVRSLKKFE